MITAVIQVQFEKFQLLNTFSFFFINLFVENSLVPLFLTILQQFRRYLKALLSGSNQINNNVNTVRLARTYWGIPSSFFEIEVQYGPPAFGRRSILNHNFSEFRWYSPIRPHLTVFYHCSMFLSFSHRQIVFLGP